MTRSFTEMLAGYAEWLGVDHSERASAWASRLAVNEAELRTFRSLPDMTAPIWRAAPATLEPARGLRSPGPSRVLGATEARKRAVECDELALFTHVPTSPLPAQRDGYLSGMPIAVKDLMAVAGAPLTGGSHGAFASRPASDAVVVSRLRAQGAPVVGMANLHEFAYGVTSANVHHGAVRNPVAPHCIPGGSSGGSAAAIAAGVVDGSVGTDTAGSIRIPAACCGVVGFKPSYDAVPRQGVLDLAPSLDHVGPMGRSVQDCAALFAAMTGEAAIPRWSVDDLAGVRVGRLAGYFDRPVDASVRRAVDRACTALEAEGATVSRECIDRIEWAAAVQILTICVEANEVHAARLRSHPAMLGEDVRVRLEIGYFLPGSWYLKAQRLRSAIARAIDEVFNRVDLLVCPTMRIPAPAVGKSTIEIEGTPYPLHTALTQFTMPFNLTGLPAVSIPWGVDASGAPLAIQLVGRRGHDWDVLAAAGRLEAHAPQP